MAHTSSDDCEPDSAACFVENNKCESEMPGTQDVINFTAAMASNRPQPSPDEDMVLTTSKQDVVIDSDEGGRRDDDKTYTDASYTTVSSRAYQLEMFNQSLHQNIIVATEQDIQMDTGSGKTQIALLRIQAELERSDPNKMIWFLAPTVSLCNQQFEAIRLQIASVPVKLVTGNDMIKSWSGDVWKSIVNEVRIVVSTPRVLLDALCHAFVRIQKLSLIIFDEAHNCTGKYEGSKIMADFYHKNSGLNETIDKPAILGLTATPSIRDAVYDLAALEAILDARCVSPTLHREELMKYVKKPQICHFPCSSIVEQPYTKSMQAFFQAYLNLDIREDPYILKLLADPTPRNRRALQKAISKRRTYSIQQISGLWRRCLQVLSQIGPWAADLYLWKICAACLRRRDEEDNTLTNWSRSEKQYIYDFLHKIMPEPPPTMPQARTDITNKVSTLLEQLLLLEKGSVCIIFAKERAIVMMLCEILSSCPKVMENFRVGAIVGESNNPNRTRNVYEAVYESDQRALPNFRSGTINLLVATAVLEEGIDVPACNVVVCFDDPETPKAFIQRRGRARMKESKIIMLTERSSTMISKWEALESEIRRLCEDEERELRKLEQLEGSDPTDQESFEVKSTGARLDFDNAKQHLGHFCSVLARGDFVDHRPDYIIHSHPESSPPRLSATVLLPPFVPEHLRRHTGTSTWVSEKNATKEAAFQAYVALYEAGLVNQNLLPLKFDELLNNHTRAPVVEAELPLNTWRKVANQWKAKEPRWIYPLTCYGEELSKIEYEIILPVKLECFRPISIYHTYDQSFRLFLGQGKPVTHEEVLDMPDHTSALLALPFGHRWTVEDRHHIIRVMAKSEPISREKIGSAQFDPNDSDIIHGKCFIRGPNGTPYLYQGTVAGKPPIEEVQHTFLDYDMAPNDVQYLILTRWTKRMDFLHPIYKPSSGDCAASRKYPWVLPQSWATVDELPVAYAQLGMLIPSLIHELEVMITVKELAETVLGGVGIVDLNLIREAISCPSANEPLNYERLEFLGDSVLKFCTSIQAAAEHLDWPEGYLSLFRDRLVSNARLCQAALDKQIVKFIISNIFTGQKWRPLYLDDYLEDKEDNGVTRTLSTKTIADVVEALIGAAFVDGGINRAMICIAIFLGDCKWKNIDNSREQIFQHARDGDQLPPVLEPLEELIGYSFRKKALLIEAMTHTTFAADTGRRSYERLEFLGDAVLDYIIVSRLFNTEPTLSHQQMHRCKTAMANADFLAFVVMEHGLLRSEPVVTEDAKVVHQETSLSIWKLMRHASPAIGLEQLATVQRFNNVREKIIEALQHSARYPWALLKRLHAKKFLSDLFESLLGAVWIDSGSLEACEAVLTRFGIIPYLERILRDGVSVVHPKEEVGILADTETVRYEVERRQSNAGALAYWCRLHIGTRAVTEIDGGLSVEDAKTRAAEEAVKLLRAERVASTGVPE